MSGAGPHLGFEDAVGQRGAGLKKPPPNWRPFSFFFRFGDQVRDRHAAVPSNGCPAPFRSRNDAKRPDIIAAKSSGPRLVHCRRSSGNIVVAQLPSVRSSSPSGAEVNDPNAIQFGATRWRCDPGGAPAWLGVEGCPFFFLRRSPLTNLRRFPSRFTGIRNTTGVWRPWPNPSVGMHHRPRRRPRRLSPARPFPFREGGRPAAPSIGEPGKKSRWESVSP